MPDLDENIFFGKYDAPTTRLLVRHEKRRMKVRHLGRDLRKRLASTFRVAESYFG